MPQKSPLEDSFSADLNKKNWRLLADPELGGEPKHGLVYRIGGVVQFEGVCDDEKKNNVILLLCY